MTDSPESPSKVTRTEGGFVLVTVIMKPFRLDAALAALKPFHVLSVTASEVRGYGRQKGHLELYRGAEYEISFIPKVKLEFTVSSAEVEEVVKAVQIAARTGRIGDGKILIQRMDSLHTEEPLPVD